MQRLLRPFVNAQRLGPRVPASQRVFSSEVKPGEEKKSKEYSTLSKVRKHLVST